MQAIEDAGFYVTRIVTNNHKKNAMLFRSMSEDKTLQRVIAHPLQEDNPLLSFNSNHMIKNLRTNLLERSCLMEMRTSKGVFSLKIYNIQSGFW